MRKCSEDRVKKPLQLFNIFLYEGINSKGGKYWFTIYNIIKISQVKTEIITIQIKNLCNLIIMVTYMVVIFTIIICVHDI